MLSVNNLYSSVLLRDNLITLISSLDSKLSTPIRLTDSLTPSLDGIVNWIGLSL
jgi:hypothetical protein